MEEKQETEKTQDSVHTDYKDIITLRQHVNPHARMNSRKRNGFSARQQRNFARAIKRARFMALIPYVSY